MRKKLIIYISLLLTIILVNPIKIQAKEEKILTCSYEYITKTNDIRKLTYEVYEGKLSLPFSDGTNYINENIKWYHGEDFKNIYLENIKVDKTTFTCPTITIEENDSYITIFNSPKAADKCNGTCKTISSITEESNKTISTVIGGSVGIYQDSKYFLPYFRLLEDGTKQWSINGKKYIDIEKAAIINTDNITTKIAVDTKLINEIFKNNTLQSNKQIYRCVTNTEKNKYTYLLTTTENRCLEKDLSKNDGQELESKYYTGAFGEPKEKSPTEDYEDWLEDYDEDQKCSGDDSLLGNPADEDSVAWLLQQILNYLKVLGPMIVVIMSSIDFAMAIIQSDDDHMAKAQKKLIYRLILAAALFFIPTLVTVILRIFGITSDPLCGLE